MNMKKVWKITKYTLLAILSLGAFFGMTYYYYTGGNNWFGRDLEKVCYGIWCLAFAVCFHDVEGGFKRLWTRIVSGITTSLLLTATVFLANNYWRYLSINCEFNWEYPIPYSTIMRWDILHTYGWGEFRYPMVFVIIFSICGLKIFFSHPKVKAIYHGWNDKFWNWLYIKNLQKENLSELYHEVVEVPDTSDLVDYVRHMPLSEDGKSKLMNFIDKHQDCLLIYLLFMHYGDLLTKEEYVKYRTLYVDITETYIDKQKEHFATAKVELPEMFRKLDDKFNITDKG